MKAWKFIFDCFDIDVFDDEALEYEGVLDNPNSNIIKFIIFIYSMETFIPKVFNKAEREKDSSKVLSLGPFANILSEVCCNT